MNKPPFLSEHIQQGQERENIIQTGIWKIGLITNPIEHYGI